MTETNVVDAEHPVRGRWLNRTTLGIGLTSLLSDWSHEIATSILPILVASLGAGPAWLGAIEGISDGLSSITKLLSGHWTDRLRRRKPFVTAAYALTAAATGAIGIATTAPHVLFARAGAWFARGVRSPAKKAMLAASVPADAYGRAFGFERMMDTVGAIAAPVTALWLLEATGHNYRNVLLLTLVPGLLAAVCFALLVRERVVTRPARRTFVAGLRELPPEFRRLTVACAVFGLGDFSHTMLILYASEKLTPTLGAAGAASAAISLYLVRNVFYAGFAYVGGWMSDRTSHPKVVLAGGYGIAAAMAVVLAAGASSWIALATAFALAGVFTGVVEALQDSLAAAMVPKTQHGMAFGTLAAVNAAGDFASSIVVGALWSGMAPGAGFAVAGGLFIASAVLVLRVKSR
jgi:MFS family permease